MSKKMLIDACLDEETRLAIINGQKIETFETETQRQIKGNIYLAQITHIEPSLQAAFVEYGGNRHGFLAFSEIHSDYFQLPKADRDLSQKVSDGDGVNLEVKSNPNASNGHAKGAKDSNEGGIDEAQSQDDFTRGQNYHQKYDIQEVVKHKQVLLVQIVKEERGTKGAALTTFLSLAGRYCVLMPNTDKSNGVSRQISNNDARSKMRDLLAGLNIPDNMSLIIRTAGAQQPIEEIERDLEYLTHLWESIRKLTLESKAPLLVYEEGDLVHRALRDMVKKDIGQIIVEGPSAYQKAKEFMELFMPSQLEILKEHKDNQPIFAQHGIENMLEDIFSPTCHLKSGGYIVINQTEALVAIDVNSGRATGEHNIENTALKTNLEAAEEVARQARLRDLAGLLVVDFIDMENNHNIRSVEKKIRDAFRSDRARVKLGKISPDFCLFQMSRQRLRPEISAGRVEACPECNGTGQVLTSETIALHALRASSAEASRAKSDCEIILKVSWPVALYILNQKRDDILKIESENDVPLRVEIGMSDDPDRPWSLEVRKSSQKSHLDNDGNQDAVNMETAYKQMTPPSQSEYRQRPQKAQRQDGRGENQNRFRSKHRHNRSRNRRNFYKRNREGAEGQGQILHPQKKKSSLWGKIFRKTDKHQVKP